MCIFLPNRQILHDPFFISVFFNLYIPISHGHGRPLQDCRDQRQLFLQNEIEWSDTVTWRILIGEHDTTLSSLRNVNVKIYYKQSSLTPPTVKVLPSNINVILSSINDIFFVFLFLNWYSIGAGPRRFGPKHSGNNFQIKLAKKRQPHLQNRTDIKSPQHPKDNPTVRGL